MKGEAIDLKLGAIVRGGAWRAIRTKPEKGNPQ